MKLLQRKIDKYLQEWKNSTDKFPLIVKGARQIGNSRSCLKGLSEKGHNTKFHGKRKALSENLFVFSQRAFMFIA